MKHSHVAALVALALALRPGTLPAADADAGIALFESKIRPVLVERCYQCHAANTKQRGGLRLDSREGLLKGGDNGPTLAPGKPSDSLIVKALHHQGPKMPPQAKLPGPIIADFVRWIELEPPDPRDGRAVQAQAIDWTKARQFWSFQPPRLPELPKVRNGTWPKNAIDRFVLARLEAENLRPVAPAGKQELIRRATFDLSGLPPTPEEVEAFVGDQAPDAFARVVDRLLASPHYGERWGRHWLDVARYAEDQAHTFGVNPNTSAFRYRDWVIAALNSDMSYDRFLKLQIAADLLLDDSAERIKHLPALGFFGLGAQYYKDNTEVAKALADELDERVDTLSRGLLGLTVACARCHDHKFDPVPTQDYYSLAGVFNSSRLTDVPLALPEEVKQFQEGQRRAREAEDRVKTYLRTAKPAVAEGQAGEIARYVVAVRRVQERRQKDTKWTAASQAKVDGLQAASLDRWVKYLDGNPPVPALEPWRQLPKPAASSAREDAVLAAAQAFQQHVQSVLAERAGTDQKVLDKDKAALLQTIFGDNGLFVFTDDEVKARLTADKKQQLEQLQREATALRKEAPEKMESRFALHGGLVVSWPVVSPVTAELTVQSLVTHWREVGLPGYAQFDNDMIFHGTHRYPDALGRVIRLCLSLGVVPVLVPPRETGFQAMIESYNGWWQAKVWSRFQHQDLEELQGHSRRYVAALLKQRAARLEAAPDRRAFPVGWKLDLKKRPCGRLVYLRRSNGLSEIMLLGKTWPLGQVWPNRLVRCEVDLDKDKIRFFTLRRKDPTSQPQILEGDYRLPNRGFQD